MLDTIISQKDYSYNEIVNLLFKLKEKYSFIDIFSIGKSVLGRDIYAAKIGINSRQVVYSGAIHGSERLTASVLMLFLEQFSSALSQTESRDRSRGSIEVRVPKANPKQKRLPTIAETISSHSF